MDGTSRRQNKIAYAFLTPAILLMIVCGLMPIFFVMYYSVHDTFAGNSFIWVGSAWFQQVLSSSNFYAALARSLGFSSLVLLIEIPLGIYIALRMPTKGFLSSLYIILFAIPMLTPVMVVGYLWKVLALPNTGVLDVFAHFLGFNYNMNNPFVVWFTLLLMDVWHWTGLVVLLCFAGFRAIPDQYYQAARIDGASPWAVFRFVQLPKLKLVLLIAVLLRFMDSFMIYTEAYVVTRGGPGVSTTFLSHELVQTATIQFDLGQGGAMAVIYFAIIAVVCWLFFSKIVPREAAA